MVGDGPEVLSVCSGGFLLDAEFTPQRLSELAKMDGAIILASDSSRVARANVHLVPDPNMPTSETGTRHRTAERVGRQLDVPVITVSEDMSLVAIHRRGEKHTLEPIPRVLARADQALQILGRYKSRLDSVSGSLSALEVEDLVTVRDVATVLQRAEMVRRIAEEIEGYVIELGADGRLVMLQLEELIGGVEDDRRLVAKDYFQPSDDFELVAPCSMRSPSSTTKHSSTSNQVAAVLHLDPEHRHRRRAAAARLPAPAQDPAPARDWCPTTSSTASRTCRRSCAPGWPTSPRSRASARCAPGRSRKVCHASPRPPSSSGTSELAAPDHRRSSCPNSRPAPTKSTSSTSR